jgi:hypothetical protein
MKLFIKILLCIFLVCVVLVCAGYYLVFHVIWQEARGEVSRVTSPDSKLDAVYVQAAAGAMTSGNYLVYIVPKGHETPKEKDKAVFHGKRTYDLEVSWKADRNLLIQYNESDIKHFQSYFYPFSDSRYKVEIQYMERSKEQ